MTFKPTDLAWCAGLFAGEGHACTITRHAASGNDLKYPQFAISMLDRGSIVLFARVFGLRVQDYKYKLDPERRVYRISGAGKCAEDVLNALLPYLKGTEKETQVRLAFLNAGWKYSKGLYVGPAGRRSSAMVGNRNRRGKKKVAA